MAEESLTTSNTSGTVPLLQTEESPAEVSEGQSAELESEIERTNEQPPDIDEQPLQDNESGGRGSGDGDDDPVDHRQRFHLTLSLLASPIVDESGSAKSVFFGLTSLSLIGASIGLIMPKNPALPSPWYRYVSAAIGYIYFLCWSVSFYPQVISNFKRRSTSGLSADFCGLNVLGFACYAAYNTAFFFSPTIQRLYKERYGDGAEITVQSNDVAFAIHAFILSSITFIQIGCYDGLRAQQPSMYILVFMLAVGLLIVIFPFVVLYFPFFNENWLDYLYLLSYIKVSISLIKYIPQVILNHQRKSTVGWSIWNIILDFSGGVLSDLQLLLDCADLKDFSGITGNLAKFGLGSISIVFDIIFMLQHYVLYVDNDEDQVSSPSPESEPLLTTEERQETQTAGAVVRMV